MIDGGQGGEHGAAHGVGLDDFADCKFIGTFPDTGFRVWGNQTIAENQGSLLVGILNWSGAAWYVM